MYLFHAICCLNIFISLLLLILSRFSSFKARLKHENKKTALRGFILSKFLPFFTNRLKFRLQHHNQLHVSQSQIISKTHGDNLHNHLIHESFLESLAPIRT